MEDVQYHLNGLFRFVTQNLALLPEDQRRAIESAANATQRAVDEAKAQNKKYAQMVKVMRDGQRAYFKASREKDYTKSQALLSASRINESSVDQRTQEILQGVVQPDLFK